MLNSPTYGAYLKTQLRRLVQWFAALLLLMPLAVSAELRIAVAANYHQTLQLLVQTYQQLNPDFVVRISSASSGKHYAQIRQGAPFDVFFSADDQLTAELEADGYTLPNSRFAYAYGQLVLWSPKPDRIPTDGLVLLKSAGFDRLAIANPRVAPYGAAAEQVLASAGITLAPRQRVTGQSIGQAFGFIVSGNAELGFAAASQVIVYERENSPGSRWVPPADTYPAIVQEAVMLRAAAENAQAYPFMGWILCSPAAHALMRADGYQIPERDETACAKHQ